MNAQTFTLQMSVVVEPDDDGSFHAYCPAFTELRVCGSTEPEAMKYVEDAIVVRLGPWSAPASRCRAPA